MRKATFSYLALVLLAAGLLVSAAPYVSVVKAQAQSSVYIYTSVGGTISQGATNLTGDHTYNFTVGQSVTFTANPDPGCKFLFWSYASQTGVNTSTTNPLVYTITASECAIQAMFVPNQNTTITSTGTQTGTAPFDVPRSLGGTTTPTEGTIYSNYNIGQIVDFTANAGSGFKFLYWLVPAASGDTVSIVTSNTLHFNVTANACALQAFFAPSDSDITVPSIPSVDEFSSAAVLIAAAVLIVAALGTFVYTRRSKI